MTTTEIILTEAVIMWALTGPAAIYLACADVHGLAAYKLAPIRNTLAFLGAGPIGLGMVLAMRAAMKAFDERKK